MRGICTRKTNPMIEVDETMELLSRQVGSDTFTSVPESSQKGPAMFFKNELSGLITV